MAADPGDNPNNCRMPRIGERLELTLEESRRGEEKDRRKRREKESQREEET